MNTLKQADDVLFANGPPLGLQRRLGFVRPGQPDFGRRAAFAVVLGWFPLVVLAAVQSILLHTDGINSLLWETGVHARYLLAVPLLVLAEAECARRLSGIAQHFGDAGLVTDRDQTRYADAIALTRSLLNSNAAEILVVALAILLTTMAALSQPFDRIPAWHKSGGVAPFFSPAGWWHILVSLPLLLVLLLGWVWRLALWALLLLRIARLDLRLIAAHPDRAAGLGFVGYSLRAFSIVAMALAVIVAGRTAHIVLSQSALSTQSLILYGGLLVAVFAVFAAPLLAFTPTLMKARHRGALEYGALAVRIGAGFEDNWIERREKVAGSRPDPQEFSTTTDLYAVVASVYELRLVPIDVTSITMFCGALLLPFIPVVIFLLPIDQVLAGLKTLLF